MFCFKKSQRLLHKADYDYVFSNPVKIVTQHFLLLCRTNDQGNARLGFAITKKKIAKAHQRNRLKRLVRERFRHCTLPPVDIIFLVRNGVEQQTNAAINNGLNATWEKVTSYFGK